MTNPTLTSPAITISDPEPEDDFTARNTMEIRRVSGLVNLVRAGGLPVVPEKLRGAIAARDHLHTLQQTIRPATTPAAFMAATIEAMTADNPPDAATFVEEASAAWLSVDKVQAATAALQQIEQALIGSFQTVVLECADEILAGLREQMAEPVKRLQAAYDLLGEVDLDSPDPVEVAAGTPAQRKAWSEIEEQTRAYRAVRYAQRSVVTSTGKTANTVLNLGDLAVDMPWSDLVEGTGLLEIRTAGQGLPPGGKATVTSPGLWLPTLGELAEAWHSFHDTTPGGQSHAVVGAQPTTGSGRPRPGALIVT